MGLFDTLLGRSKPVRANLDALFALPTAALTLQSAGGLVSSGHAGVCWKPPAGQAAADAQKEVAELVGEGFGQAVDSFDYGWLLVGGTAGGGSSSSSSSSSQSLVPSDADASEVSGFEDLVTRVHMANSTLSDNGWGPQLLASAFGFVPGADAPADAKRFRLIYLFKRGTFYPFAPIDDAKERRDTELELRIRSMVGSDLPFEADLSRWFPMWDMPVT